MGSVSTLAVRSSPAKPEPIAVPAQSAVPSPSIPPTRKVVLTLPFLATHVTLDEMAQKLDPATDVVAFDVPSASGFSHQVTAVSVDGTRARGHVREDDGVARPDGEGYSYLESQHFDMGEPPRSSSSRGPRLGGAKRNGFTKLQ